MKKLILLLLLCGLWAAGTHAQTKTDDITIEQVTPTGGESDVITDGDLLERYAGITGISTLQRTAAEANQVGHIHMSGSTNEAHIIQAGTGNIGAINVSGAFNASTLHQSGNDLLSLIHIKGRGNQLDVSQNGNNLGNLVQVLGSGMKVGITQDKAGFRYRQAGAANPITITSNARNVPVIIRNN